MARPDFTVEIGNPTLMGQPGERNVITVDWESNGSGRVSGELAATFSEDIGEHWKTRPTKITGTLKQVNTIPGTLGDLTTSLPDDGYDIEIKGPYNNELTGGSLTNRSNISGEMYTFDNPVFVDFPITFQVLNAGDQVKGRTILIFQD